MDVWGGDACVAHVPFPSRLVPPPMGDASVPTLPPNHPRPYETTPLPSSFQKNLPVKAGVDEVWGGDACVALEGGGRYSREQDEATQASLRVRRRLRSVMIKNLLLKALHPEMQKVVNICYQSCKGARPVRQFHSLSFMNLTTACE